MVGEWLVPKSTAVNGKNGDFNGGFGTGLNGKKSAFAPHRLLLEEKMLKSEQLLDTQVRLPVKRNGKNGHNVFQNGLQIAKGIAQVVKNGGNSDFANDILDYNAKAPLQWKEVFGLAKFTYYNWLLKEEPSNVDARLAVEQYKPYFRSRARLLAEQGGEEERKASMFIMEAKELSISISRQLIRARREMNEKLGRFKRRESEIIAEIESNEKLEMGAKAQFYQKKDALLSGMLNNGFKDAEKLVKIAKYAAKYAEYIIPAIGGSAAILAGASPELIGALAAGVGLGVKALKWHLAVVQTHLPDRKAKKLEKIREKKRLEKEEVMAQARELCKEAEAQFEKKESEIKENVRMAHYRLCRDFGYLLAG